MRLSRVPGTTVVLLCAALLAACATPTAPDSGTPSADRAPATGAPALGAVAPGLPDGEVIGQGTVLDADGDVQLCLGGVMESLPPQCTGIPLRGWTWDDADGADSSGASRWGAYAVQGTYDGASFTLSAPPIPLALYDPASPDDPTAGEPGPADEARLAEVQDDIHARLGETALSSWPQNGRLWVQVVWDDGTLQDAVDARYGADVVVVHSSLREVG